MGVDQAFLYPTWFAEGFHLVEDPDVAYALARAYNNWIADFCKAAPDRLFAAAMIPLQNMDYAVEELRRIAKIPCFRGAFIRPDVYRGTLLHPSVLRPAVGGAGEPGRDGRGPSHRGFVESGVDLARTVYREGKEPAHISVRFSACRRRAVSPAAAPRNPGFPASPPLGHPMAPILSHWLDNHMFVASTLDRLHRDAALSEDEGGGRARQGLVDGGGAGEDGSLHADHSAAALLSGAHRHRGDVGGRPRDARLRRRGAADPEAARTILPKRSCGARAIRITTPPARGTRSRC